jgi:hypothetical protein
MGQTGLRSCCSGVLGSCPEAGRVGSCGGWGRHVHAHPRGATWSRGGTAHSLCKVCCTYCWLMCRVALARAVADMREESW